MLDRKKMDLLWILVLPLVAGVAYWAMLPAELVVSVPPPYEARFSLDQQEVVESDENRAMGVVEEDTPEGRVRLKYAQEGFDYWADKAISYRYLETVARKYVILYDCRERYVNMFRELLKAYEAPKPPPPPPINSVFASFKVYAPIKAAKIVNERANRYSWKGRIPVPEVPREGPKAVSYAAYKKMN